jgi:EAL domain-containing protein (putative c-di-GMP-specific phosphodiesterase class I)
MSSSKRFTLPPDSSDQLAYVLDDQPEARAIVCNILASVGYVPRQFAGLVPFFEGLKNAAPELIVLDVIVAQSDAIEVIRYLEAFRYRGKVLLISGCDSATLGDIQRIGEDHGLTMLPSVQKPFHAADLKNRLSRAAEAQNVQRPAKSRLSAQNDACQVQIDPIEALRNCWLRLWYQAKVDLESMTVCGAEALLRASHPEFGIVSPANFLPPSGSVIYQPLTKFVVLQAMADWEHFAAQGQPLKLAINVPLYALHSPAFVDLVRKSLPKKANFPGLIVEVTEGDALIKVSGLREIAAQLKLYNVGISLNDFGEAHSSLARLRDLPCIELKLHRSYVSGCATDGAKRSFCAAAVELAHGFGLTVCAEGVENVNDLRTLIDLGCHSAQGFLFAKPMDSVSFVNLLRAPSVEPRPRREDGRDDAPAFDLTADARP